MKKFLMSLMANAISLWIIDYLMSSVYIDSPGGLILIAFALMVLNATMKPVLKLLSFPITFFSFGLFSLVINGIVLYTAFHFSNGSYITGIGSAVIASILLSAVNAAVNKLMK